MWLIADYRAVSLFSLKMSTATSSGAKSLLLPTPFALKMALLDAACRLWGAARAEMQWPAIRDRRVGLRPPERVVVTNSFSRILKPKRGEPEGDGADSGPLGRTIAFREYVYHHGPFGVALDLAEDQAANMFVDLLLQVSYLGKRGGFVQLAQAPEAVTNLPEGFVLADGRLPSSFPLESILQQMDDCDESMTFGKANIYSGVPVKLGSERVLHNVVLPYRVARSSKSFTLYERVQM